MGVEAVATMCPEWEGKWWRFDYELRVPLQIVCTSTQQARRHAREKENKSAALVDILEGRMHLLRPLCFGAWL